MRGRKPTPTPILAARNSPRAAARIKAGEPRPPAEAPTAPPHLDKTAKAEWRRVIPLLEQMGMLAQADRAALAMYCQAYSRWTDAEQQIAADGAIVKSPNGYPIQNPYLAVANKAIDQMTRLLAEFGLSPAARSRLGAAATKPAAPSFALRSNGPPLLKIAT